MSDQPTLDLSGYHTVLIVKAGEVDAHQYRRGARATVDPATLAKMREQGMVDDVKPATVA